MESTKIRLAQENDIEQLCRLNEEVQAIHIRLSPGIFRHTDLAEVENRLRMIMGDSSKCILVAERAGAVIGYLILQKQIKPAHAFCNERRCAYIDQVCIAENYRRTGIFTQFMAQVETIARDWGMPTVELSVWSDNAKGKDAFEKSGFSTYNEKMRKEIGTVQT